MLVKLTLQNAKRSVREYVIYIITLVMASAFMQAFNSLIFSENIQKICSMGAFVGIMIGFAGVIVFLILFWLVNYMIGFMLKRRSKEFATYQILGIEEKQIGRMFFWENMLIGMGSLILGFLPGSLFQMLLGRLFLGMYLETTVKAELCPQSYLLTAGMYFVIFFISLMKTSRRFSKMSIMGLLKADKQNDSVQKKIVLKIWLLPISVAYFITFNICLIKRIITVENSVLFLGAFVICCYLFYNGLSGCLQSYVEKRRDGVYKGSTIVLLRQLLSKVQSMRVVMGTIMMFFTFAFASFSIAIMFHDYLKTQVNQKLPFDLLIYESNPAADFTDEITLLESYVQSAEQPDNEQHQIQEQYIYRIYHSESTLLRDYLMTHRVGEGEIQIQPGQADYFEFDTYMVQSDYNALMNMLGRKELLLKDNECIIQTKKRFCKGLEELLQSNSIYVGDSSLQCVEYRTEGFALNGQNGADFVIVVPDCYQKYLYPYYSIYAAGMQGEISESEFNKLKSLVQEKNKDSKNSIIWGRGSDDFVTVTDVIQVKSVQGKEICFVLGAIAYPLIYIGIIMLCVGITILSVHQLSDLPRYRRERSILQNMGMTEAEAGKMLGKQMAVFYLLPYLTAVLVGMGFTIWISAYFIFYTGLNTFVFGYFLETVAVVTVVYGGYYLLTYRYIRGNRPF